MKFKLNKLSYNGLPTNNGDGTLTLSIYVETIIDGVPEGKFIQGDNLSLTIDATDSVIDIQNKCLSAAQDFIRNNYGELI